MPPTKSFADNEQRKMTSGAQLRHKETARGTHMLRRYSNAHTARELPEHPSGLRPGSISIEVLDEGKLIKRAWLMAIDVLHA